MPVRETATIVAPINDPQAEMEKSIDGLMMCFCSNASDSEKATELMLFLYRLLAQRNQVTKDCLSWAVDRCFLWTREHQTARDAYLSAQLKERTDRKEVCDE